MSDIKSELVTAYKTDLGTQQGSTLSWMRFYDVVGETDLTNWYGLLPLVLISVLPTSIEPDSLEGDCQSNKKIYTIVLSAVVYSYDRSYGTQSPNVPDLTDCINKGDDLESLYNRNKLGLSQACTLVARTEGALFIPGFQTDGQTWAHGSQLTFEHDWIDRRTS